jgi:flavin reductase (DIM6/NTAB) family NADH-FMN oxidoreductase RutF
MLTTTNPAILYFGTPVVLVSSLNPDGSANLAPMSSAWWLGWRCMLGFGARSATPQNILRTGECVLNLPSAAMAPIVDRLALTTASDPVPEFKQKRGYRHEAQKFERAELTPVPSEVVAPPRALECPIQLEARLTDSHRIAEDNAAIRGNLVALEVEIVRAHADSSILMPGERDRNRSGQVAPAHHEFSAILRPHATPAGIYTSDDSRISLQAENRGECRRDGRCG